MDSQTEPDAAHPQAFQGHPGDDSPAAMAKIAVLQAALEHRELQIDAMRRISDAVFNATSIDGLMREILNVALETVGADAGSLQLHDPARDALIFRYVVGPMAENLIGFVMPASQGIGGRVFRTGQPDITRDAHRVPDFNQTVDERTGYKTQSMVSVPVKRANGLPLGVMQILNFDENYDEFDLEVLQVIAGQAAAAIENARLSQQARKAAMVNLIGDVSHDIKNMLTPIQTGVWTLDPMIGDMFRALDAVSRHWPEEVQAQFAKESAMVREDYGWILQHALDATERIQLRTKEISDAVKGESAPPRFEEGDFNALVKETISALRLVAHDAQVELLADLDPALPRVEFDRKQLLNALYNLVNNAIPETPEGGSVTIRTRALNVRESNFLVEVADTGRGMSDYVRDRLFTDDAVSTKPGGTGLGSRIVADIVRRHKGQIAVTSEEGQGTTFTMLLPMRQDR